MKRVSRVVSSRKGSEVGVRLEGLESRQMLAVQLGDHLYYDNVDAEHGRELWQSNLDGSNPQVVADIRPGAESSNPDDLMVAGNTLYFTANDGERGDELWKSDGTAQGTQMVIDLRPGLPGGVTGLVAVVNGTLHFQGTDDDSIGSDLWLTDGTAEGTQFVSPTSGGYGSPRLGGDGQLYFLRSNRTVMRTGGDGVIRTVLDIPRTAFSSEFYAAALYAGSDGGVVYYGYPPHQDVITRVIPGLGAESVEYGGATYYINDHKLYKQEFNSITFVDGGDFNTLPYPDIRNLFVARDTLYYVKNMYDSGSQQTVGHLYMLNEPDGEWKSLVSGASYSIQVFGKEVYFRATTPAPLTYLWSVTDGEVAVAIPNSNQFARPEEFEIPSSDSRIQYGDYSYFIHDGGLWKQHNSGFIQPVTSQSPVNPKTEVKSLLQVGNRLYYLLESIDALAGKTTQTLYFLADPQSISRAIPGTGAAIHLEPEGDKLYFRVASNTGGIYQWYVHDGVTTTLIPNSNQSARPRNATLINGVLTVTGSDLADQITLVRSPSQPQMIKVVINGQVTAFNVSSITFANVQGLEGHDTIRFDERYGAISFAARLYGGAGNDSIIGGSGGDRVYGGAGNDWLAGGLGNDTLYGEAGNDRIFGGEGRDYLDGGSDADLLRGEGGQDRIIAKSSEDDFRGNSGDILTLLS